MVAELNNTFGERLPFPRNRCTSCAGSRYEHRKRLHVSPFFGLDQSYEYAFSQPGERGLGAHPRPRRRRGAAAHRLAHGRRRELDDASLARGRSPATRCMPLQVTARIHLAGREALAKRVPFFHKPPFVPGGDRCD